jgi:hypothetical protein
MAKKADGFDAKNFAQEVPYFEGRHPAVFKANLVVARVNELASAMPVDPGAVAANDNGTDTSLVCLDHQGRPVTAVVVVKTVTPVV